VEYVFVAGNTSDTGILQLMAFEPRGKQPIVLWSRLGKVQSSPMLSVVDGNSLFAVRDGSLTRYPWRSSEGAYEDKDMKEQVLPPGGRDGTSAVLVDGADSVYVLGTKSAGQQFLSAYDSAHNWQCQDQQLALTPNLQFTTDGTLIGYDTGNVYDLSPKVVDLAKTVNTLANKTIHSADSVTVAPDAAKQLKDGDQVILKGHVVKLPKRFGWPPGKMLKVQTVPKGP